MKAGSVLKQPWEDSWLHCIHSQEAESEEDVQLGYETWKPIPVNHFHQQNSAPCRFQNLLK